VLTSAIALFIVATFVADVTKAQQTEIPRECSEGNEPLTLAYADHTVGCSIDPAVDLDTFVFEGQANDAIRINVLSRTATFDPRLELRDPAGNVVADTFCNGGFVGNSSRCSFTLETELMVSGTYAIALSDVSNNETGNYILQLERIPPVDDPPNVPYNTTASGGIDPATDVDFLSFEGAAGTDVRLTVLSRTATFDPRLEIRDPTGTLVEEMFCNGGFIGNSSRCSFVVDLSLVVSGTYLLTLSDVSTNELGDYELNVQCLFGDCPRGSSTTPNRAPRFMPPIGDQRVNQGETLTFPVVATDPDGDNLTLTDNLPDWCVVDVVGNGRRWRSAN
jgi:hypothetical protein